MLPRRRPGEDDRSPAGVYTRFAGAVLGTVTGCVAAAIATADRRAGDG